MEKKKVISPLIINIIAGFIVAFIVFVAIRILTPTAYYVQIEEINQGQHVEINKDNLRETPNQDGILFIQAKGTTKEYEDKLVVEVRPKDAPDWFKQDDVIPSNDKFVTIIQLGTREWPIRGGEEYDLKVSAGGDSAIAKISVEETKKYDCLRTLIIGIIAGLIVVGITTIIKRSGPFISFKSS